MLIKPSLVFVKKTRILHIESTFQDTIGSLSHQQILDKIVVEMLVSFKHSSLMY
jgi:hypothetical protein